MTFRRIAVTLLTGLLLSKAAFSLEPRHDSGERQKGCSAVHIEAVGTTSESTTGAPAASTKRGARSERARGRHRFAARDVLDLRFDVVLRGRDQSGLVEVALFTPSGHLYETLKTERDSDPGASTRASYQARRGRVVTATLPVAGTFITRRSLYGEWRAEIHLDGDEAACARPTTFVLEP